MLTPSLFTLYTLEFRHNTDCCHLQKFSDGTAIFKLVSQGNDLEHREVIASFENWCELHLHIDPSKTKEVVIDFSRKPLHTTPVNMQGLDTEIMEQYKVFTPTTNWIGHTTLMPCTRRA